MQHTSPERAFGVVTLSGTVAGLIAAIGARMAMRIVALGAHQPLLFTFEGTFHILLLGTLSGFMLGAIISSLCVPLLESPRTRRYVQSMFGALIIIYGITLGVAEKVFDRYLPRRPTSAKKDIPTSIPSEEA